MRNHSKVSGRRVACTAIAAGMLGIAVLLMPAVAWADEADEAAIVVEQDQQDDLLATTPDEASAVPQETASADEQGTVEQGSAADDPADDADSIAGKDSDDDGTAVTSDDSTGAAEDGVDTAETPDQGSVDAASDDADKASSGQAETAPDADLTAPEDDETPEEDETPEVTPPIADGTYVIQTGVGGVKGQQVLDATGGKATNKANIETYSFNGGDNQLWDLKWIAAYGAYTIAFHNTDYVLDVSGAVAANNQNVILYKATEGKANQLWKVQSSGAGWNIISVLNPTFVLDVYREQEANGTNVALYTMKGNSAQLFYLLSFDFTPAEDYVLESGVYEIASAAGTSFVLDVHGASASNSANVEVYSEKRAANQKWQITRDADGYYTITSINSGKVLDVDHASPIPGANMLQYTGKGTANQKWAIRFNEDDETLTFINKATGLVLDISGGKAYNSANVIGYRYNGNSNQRWILSSVEYLEPGIYEVKPLSNDAVSLDIYGGNATDGAAAQLYSDKDTINQRFQVIRVAENVYRIRTADSGGWLTDSGDAAAVIQSGSSKTEEEADTWEAFWNGSYYSLRNTRTSRIIDLNGTVASGTKTKASSEGGLSTQYFRFVSSNLITPGVYRVHSGVNSAGSFVLDVSGASASAGANIIIYTQKNASNQYFRFERYGDGYKITSLVSGLVITGGDASGANISQQAFTGSKSQVWIPVIADGGYVCFQSAANPSTVIDVAGAKAANSTNVLQYNGKDGTNQKWKLEAIKFGWYKQNGHWFYFSDDPRAVFQNDINSSGKDLGHYDVLYELWRKVNGYVSGSLTPYASKTGYLICTSWDSCYVAVFKGAANSTARDNWQPLFGWNCGNGNMNVINQDAKDQAAAKGKTTTWTWNPAWDRWLALGNTRGSSIELPANNEWARSLGTTYATSRRPSVPSTAGEKWFTSVSYTLGFHTTITKTPANELGKHVSHGCIRLEYANAKWIYDNIYPGTRCLQVRTTAY